jgi:outer membrane protein W
MKYAIRVFSLALLMVLAGNAKASAQGQQWWWGFTYQAALSTGDTKDFVDQLSWRNFGIEGRSMIGQDASVGLFFGWNVFNQEVDGTIGLGAVDVSGYQSRFVNAVPMLATAHYYFGQRSGPRSYVGTGVGTYWIENRLELGQTAVTAQNWHFGLAPEVGVIIPTDAMAQTYLNVKYNYAFKAGDIQRSYWTFGIGFATRY